MKLCEKEGCNKPFNARGLCKTHYSAYRRGKEFTRKKVHKYRDADQCLTEGCSKKPKAKGRCQSHSDKLRRHGDEFYEREIGKSWHSPQGYLLIKRDGKVIRQHRHVMQQHLGRELFEGEHVHHINGVRDDNRLENLELWNTSQPSGQRVEDKIKFYIKFLVQYGYEVNKL